MTIERSGLAAGLQLDTCTLEVEILTALMQVRRTNDRSKGDGYGKKLVGAILRAVLASEMLRPDLADEDAEFAEMIADAATAVEVYIGEVERPTTRLEDDILIRLRAVPNREALAARYEDARDAERVRRRGLIRAMLDAASKNAFAVKASDEIVVDLDDPDIDIRSDFLVSHRDFLLDCERMDAGLKAIHCMAEADHVQNDLTPPATQRDALIWAMVAIETGSGHSKQRTQAMRCTAVAEYTDCLPSTLRQYLKELKKGRRPKENGKFSEAEHQLFQDRTALVRKIATDRGAGWDLVVPALRGWAKAALPKPAFKNRVHKPRKVTPEV